MCHLPPRWQAVNGDAKRYPLLVADNLHVFAPDSEEAAYLVRLRLAHDAPILMGLLTTPNLASLPSSPSVTDTVRSTTQSVTQGVRNTTSTVGNAIGGSAGGAVSGTGQTAGDTVDHATDQLLGH